MSADLGSPRLDGSYICVNDIKPLALTVGEAGVERAMQKKKKTSLTGKFARPGDDDEEELINIYYK